VYGFNFFTETTITGIVYLDMFQQFLIPQLDEYYQEGRIHFQQDGAPPYLDEVREYLNSRFPGRWIGRTAPISWPPRSPDLTHLDFFLWGFVKELLPAAVAEVTPEMIHSVWQDTDYRWDVCRIANGSHIEP
jgi:hypothetical protein